MLMWCCVTFITRLRSFSSSVCASVSGEILILPSDVEPRPTWPHQYYSALEGTKYTMRLAYLKIYNTNKLYN